MPDIPATLTDAQYARLIAEAENEGISVDELVSRLLSEGVNRRYLLPVSSGVVVHLEGLKKFPSES